MERRRRWVFVCQWIDENKDHFSDCYFCMTKISGVSKKTKSEIKYPDCDSAIKPVPHSNKYPVSEPLSVLTAFDSESEASTNARTSSASEFDASTILERTSSEPHILSQGYLQDFKLVLFESMNSLQSSSSY